MAAVEIDGELANWWEDLSLADADGQRALIEAARSREGVRRVRGAPRSAAAVADTGAGTGQEPESQPVRANDAEPARKRRRRRRKPAGGGEGAAASPDAAGDA